MKIYLVVLPGVDASSAPVIHIMDLGLGAIGFWMVLILFYFVIDAMRFGLN